MKKLNQFITEKLKLNNKVQEYKYHPKTTDELKELIDKLIKERGINADFNDIDTSRITDMKNLFHGSEFNGDISKWNVSNVENMYKMFYKSEFNGDISEWDVSNVKDMYKMFTRSKFNGDISQWNINKLEKKFAMFRFCPLENNPPVWYKK